MSSMYSSLMAEGRMVAFESRRLSVCSDASVKPIVVDALDDGAPEDISILRSLSEQTLG